MKTGARRNATLSSPGAVEPLARRGPAHEHGKTFETEGAEWRGAILFAYFTGARLQDVANITPGDSIDLPARTITYRAKKGGKLVTVPMHAELESHLLALPAADNDRRFVFPRQRAEAQAGGAAFP